ncbi:NINE protein [Kocuria flava]|uniref:NINE protein n=1 Tax=Kocuria flava TaxID=446860 RepID=UPI001FF1B3FF|nr:NINE protein [Kocuria flava]MCJ8504047.1 NINE protein [Kocuria flava]
MAPEPEYYRPVPLDHDPSRAGWSGNRPGASGRPAGSPFGGAPSGGRAWGPASGGPAFGGSPSGGAPFGSPQQPVVTVVGGKSLLLAYVLWLLLGWLGVHKFYLRQPVWGLIYLGLGGLGWSLAGVGIGFLLLIPWALLMFLDIFTMPFRTAFVNASIARSAWVR